MSKPKQLLKYTEWTDGCGNWLCNDLSDLQSIRSLWWAPARMLNLSPSDFVEMLIKDFKPDRIKYFEEADVLVYSWKSQAKMRVFKNWLNAQARKYNYII